MCNTAASVESGGALSNVAPAVQNSGSSEYNHEQALPAGGLYIGDSNVC